ncbi:MAG: 5-bromo-4-chloroindolyl phosphate hydrolysis family protein [Lachnospiraceae bacterium]|nr:5-bromo-4-chloroindolyl phosphate hydrolysis family protein [Lachnospiraceae bacterium]MBQ6196977.1 5-bromo-4-chloroindolyl phosphate hydrolysis family protein [Lachnospiraceae bacterium]
MRNNNGGSSTGILALIAVIAILFGVFGGGLSAVLAVLGGALGLIVLIVAAVMFFAFKGSSEEADQAAQRGQTILSTDEAQTLANARHQVTDIRMLNTRIDDPEIRRRSNEVCDIMDKLLKAMKEDPKKISDGQMFLQYYLPTQKEILTKYERIEESGVAAKDQLAEKVLEHLYNIKTATQKQLGNVFDDAVFDVDAEIELMKQSMREDGLMN